MKGLCVGLLLAAVLAAGAQDSELRLRRRIPWSEVKVQPRTQTPAALADLGDRLYGWNCLPCHGPDGKGDGPEALRRGLRPRDFTRGGFKLKTSLPDEMPFDEDLYRTVSAGIAAGGMPAHGDFGGDQIWALVDRIKDLSDVVVEGRRLFNHFQRSPARNRLPIPRDRAPDPARGADAYRRLQCARCHGDRGRGDGPAAATLVDADGRPMGLPDLTRGEIAFKAGAAAEDLFRILSTGMPGTPMPSFHGVCPPGELWDLAGHLRSLYVPVKPGEQVYLALGCQSCHSIGRGRLVGPDLAGVLQRHDPEWLRRWLKDPTSMMITDPKARELVRQFTVQMPNLNLNDAEIGALLDYFATFPKEPLKEEK